MVERKGQAAMEFLMTYGWALLVVLVAIGALAFFGVLNPSQFLPSTCTITPGLHCEDFIVSEAGGVTVVIQNGLGEDITGVVLDGKSCGDSGIGVPIADGASATLVCGTPVGLDKGGKYSGSEDALNLTYVAGLPHKKVVNLVTQIEA